MAYYFVGLYAPLWSMEFFLDFYMRKIVLGAIPAKFMFTTIDSYMNGHDFALLKDLHLTILSS